MGVYDIKKCYYLSGQIASELYLVWLASHCNVYGEAVRVCVSVGRLASHCNVYSEAVCVSIGRLAPD